MSIGRRAFRDQPIDLVRRVARLGQHLACVLAELGRRTLRRSVVAAEAGGGGGLPIRHAVRVGDVDETAGRLGDGVVDGVARIVQRPPDEIGGGQPRADLRQRQPREALVQRLDQGRDVLRPGAMFGRSGVDVSPSRD